MKTHSYRFAYTHKNKHTQTHRKTPANPTPQYRMETQLSKVTQQKRHMKTHSYSCVHSQKQTRTEAQENPCTPNTPVQDGNSTFNTKTSTQTHEDTPIYSHVHYQTNTHEWKPQHFSLVSKNCSISKKYCYIHIMCEFSWVSETFVCLWIHVSVSSLHHYRAFVCLCLSVDMRMFSFWLLGLYISSLQTSVCVCVEEGKWKKIERRYFVCGDLLLQGIMCLGRDSQTF